MKRKDLSRREFNKLSLAAFGGALTGALVGAGKGVVKGAKRFVIGFWEMATFYLPMKNNYKPIIEPEIVFMEYQ